MQDTPYRPLVYVIILAYQDRPAVLRCLASVHAQDYQRYRIVVVDNASQDDTVEAVRRMCPACEIICNARNLGFAAGCNVGMRHALEAGAELLLLLNQDTTIAPDMLSTLVRAASLRPQAGIIGPQTFFLAPMPDGRPRLYYSGAWQRRLPLDQRIPGIEQPDTGAFERAGPVDYVWGHGMLLRAQMLQRIGLFDPAFFMYYEDLDLCRRAAAAGYQIWYEPAARMWHDTPDGARATVVEAWRWGYKVESMYVFHRKHYGRRAGWLLTALTVLNEGRQLWARGHRRAARQLVSTWLRSMI